MSELIQEALSIYNLPLTFLLGVMLLYWAMVVIGALDFDMDLPDIGDGGHDIGHVGHGPVSHVGGAWITTSRVFGFAKVPIAIWGSFLILFLWATALVLNRHYNGDADHRSFATAALLLLPNLVGSLILTKLVTMPFGRLFAAMSDADTEEEAVIGRSGVVCSVEATESYGQLQINGLGAPLLLNVRVPAGEASLTKGQSAKVISAGPDSLYYFIEPTSSDS